MRIPFSFQLVIITTLIIRTGRLGSTDSQMIAFSVHVSPAKQNVRSSSALRTAAILFTSLENVVQRAVSKRETSLPVVASCVFHSFYQRFGVVSTGLCKHLRAASGAFIFEFVLRAASTSGSRDGKLRALRKLYVRRNLSFNKKEMLFRAK